MFRLLLTLFLTILAVPAASDRIKQLISSQNWLFRLLLAILSYQTPHKIHYSGCSWLSCLSCWQWWHTSFSTAVTDTSGNLSFQGNSLYTCIMQNSLMLYVGNDFLTTSSPDIWLFFVKSYWQSLLGFQRFMIWLSLIAVTFTVRIFPLETKGNFLGSYVSLWDLIFLKKYISPLFFPLWATADRSFLLLITSFIGNPTFPIHLVFSDEEGDTAVWDSHPTN